MLRGNQHAEHVDIYLHLGSKQRSLRGYRTAKQPLCARLYNTMQSQMGIFLDQSPA